MNVLTLDNITKSYGERRLFKGASFYLQEGEKVGVIGLNGAGKSTLLKMMAGLEEPDEGTLTAANHVVIRFLPQHPEFDPQETVLQAALKGNVTKENEWEIQAEVKSMLIRLGIADFDARCRTLSGGQRKRIALVSALLSPADILLLDEPTNHLDNGAADWLEDVLKKRKGALVMVTHDRYFLDSVTERIVEIDRGAVNSFPGNYEVYLERKAQMEEMAEAGERKRRTILRNELAWMQRGARARSTKQKARIQRYEELKNREAAAVNGKVELASVSSRMGRTTVELSHISKAYGEKKLIDDFSYVFLKNDRVGFIGPNGCGKTTLMKLLTGQLLPDSGQIEVGQTIKIGYYAQEIGTAAAGTERAGEGQEREERRKEGGEGDNRAEEAARPLAELRHVEMDPSKRVIDYIRDASEYVQTSEGSVSASQMLERFLFSGEDQYGLIGKLSGGEKRRLNLLRVLMEAPNVLILDEPTNDLDVTTLAILEDYLDSFEGIVIAVSHDRYFLDRVVKRIFAFEEGGRLKQYEGGYTDYALRLSVEAELAKKAQNAAGEQTTGRRIPQAQPVRPEDEGASGGRKKGKPDYLKAKKLKFTFQEQKDYDTIEADIAALEGELEALDGRIAAAATDFVKLNELTARREETEKTLEEKMERWMYLEDLAARIAGEAER